MFAEKVEGVVCGAVFMCMTFNCVVTSGISYGVCRELLSVCVQLGVIQLGCVVREGQSINCVGVL